jgi:integrase
MLMLRLRDIDFDTGLLRIPPEVSKNHTERTIALGHDVLKYFRELQNHDYSADSYIFSTDFKPGERLYTTKNMFSTWKRMRERLSMPDTYHFYSLKDTGITEMLESGMPSKYVKDLAGHHSLSMTERYLHISDAKRILKANTIRF